MKLSKDEFKKLQQFWYQRLEEEGFNDIERENGKLKPMFEPTDLREEYYYRISQTVANESTVYRNKVEKHIMTRHSEGVQINLIVEELKVLGMKRERKTVRIIIRKYEMAWKIRTYTPKQLNQYKKKAVPRIKS